jgi:hypothetical protein
MTDAAPHVHAAPSCKTGWLRHAKFLFAARWMRLKRNAMTDPETDPHQAHWSQHVTKTSDALDLKEGVFKETDPKKIAASLKRSAEHSNRRKSDPYRSAMAMLTFYINRAGDTLPGEQRDHLEAAKHELRTLYGKNDAPVPVRNKRVNRKRRESPE